ncbi:carbamoyl transferase [bacterium]|nr:carbamoyl transferase [bacterium]
MHDSAAAIIRDGELIAFVEEERFNRKKHTHDYPQNAIDYCLREAGITINEVDHAAFFWNPYEEIKHKIVPFLTHLPYTLSLFRGGSAINPFFKRILTMLFIESKLKKSHGFNPDIGKLKFHFIDHHLAHAASAFFISKFDEAAVFIADGYSEYASSMLARGQGNKIQKIKTIVFPHSLGQLYGAITEHLGFRICNGEGKVMALASFGEPKYRKVFDRIVNLENDGSYWFDMSFLAYQYYGLRKVVSDKFISFTHERRKKGDPILGPHEDIAASLQENLEKSLFYILTKLHEITGSDNLCYSGGVALNSVANGKIKKCTPFKNVFIQPSANDAGTALGACYYLYNAILNKKRSWIFEHTYYGPRFSDEDCRKALESFKLDHEYYEDIFGITAEHIKNGKIVGWFQDRMEVGPRALGNRSILANPSIPEMKDILNLKVKHRETFRPFAPAIMEEKLNEYFDADDYAPYMLRVYPIKEDKRDKIPAACHVDGSGRVQTVSKKTNPRFHKLIESFEKLTGLPIVINTSFNVQGEPIVCTPEDAIKCFLGTKMDVLVLNNYLVIKGSELQD